MPKLTQHATSPANVMQMLTKCSDDRLAKLAGHIVTHGHRLPLFARHLCGAANEALTARAFRTIAGAATKHGDTALAELASASAAQVEADALDHVTASVC